MIYLKRQNKLIIKIFIFLFLIFLITSGGYYLSYLRYNDKELIDYEALKIENDELRALKNLDYLQNIENTYLVGRVITRDIHDFYHEVIINLGQDDGIKEGSAVINSEGLIGITYKVMEHKTIVKLLTSDYNISVKINDTYGNLNNGTISLLDKYNTLNEGDEVYTSNYGGLPNDIYIGKVTKILPDSEKLGCLAQIDLVDNRHLNYIAVVLI